MSSTELPKGITIRKNSKSEVIRIFFMYRNVICREIVHLPPTKENIKKAAHKRNIILQKLKQEHLIMLNTFLILQRLNYLTLTIKT